MPQMRIFLKGDKVMLSMYPACFYKEKEGGYSVIFPELNIATCGDTFEEATKMAVDLLAGYLYDLKLEKKDYPEAIELSKVNPNEEYDEYESVIVNMVTVDVEEYAKVHFEKAVKKTLTIPKWLNDLALENNVNFSQVLQRALKEQLNV